MLQWMQNATDPYQILQVVPDAEPEVVRAAYRALRASTTPMLGAPPC